MNEDTTMIFLAYIVEKEWNGESIKKQTILKMTNWINEQIEV